MDVAYDRIQDEALPDIPHEKDDSGAPTKGLGADVQEAYNAISSSSWGARLGGFLGSVKKQGEQYYEGARQELSAASSEASKGLADFVSQTKSRSLREEDTESRTGETNTSARPSLPADIAKEAHALFSTFSLKNIVSIPPAEQPSASSDIVSEKDSLITRFQSEAATRFKQIQKAEDAADEALERFGLNIKDFFREAVTIAPPTMDDDGKVHKSLLFESKDADGRRVVHATRFEAQLHAIHSTAPSFTQNPESDAYKHWKETFNVESETDEIAKDLDKYTELRRAMERLVPEQADYASFWTRYYFLRHVIETQDQRRRELLKGTVGEEEDVAWDDDEEEEKAEQLASTGPIVDVSQPSAEKEVATNGSSTPTNSRSAEEIEKNDMLKPAESRKSNEHSVTDSDASYDLLSAGTSRGPGTPAFEKEVEVKISKTVKEESDEEDWE